MYAMLYTMIFPIILGAVAFGFLLWSIKSGQYSDSKGAAERLLFHDERDDN